jgi:hypothetical protein
MKPQTLYRGVVLSYESLPTISWHNADLVVHYDPIVDAYGRNTVRDGNEYGVYMTDNISVAIDAYGNPRGKGTPLKNSPQLIVSGARTTIDAPDIGIVYQINTDGIAIREPFICSVLRGHYNNGFGGKEWIADIIPKENIEIVQIKIAKDLLHESQIIKALPGESIEAQLDRIMAYRIQRLQNLAQELRKLPQKKLNCLTSIDMQYYKEIFGENGFKEIHPRNIMLDNAANVAKYILVTTCQQQDIDIPMIREIKQLASSFSEHDPPEVFHDAVIVKINALETKIESRIKSGMKCDGFVNSLARLQEILNIYMSIDPSCDIKIGNDDFDQTYDIEINR